MALTDTLKGAWSGNGKKWVIGGAVLGGGYLWWTRVRSAKPATAAGDATITAGGSAVAAPVTPPGGDYSPSTNATRPSTNGQWIEQVVTILIAAPYNRPGIATWNALSKALNGDPLTTAEAAIVELAIQVRGTPPEGMPPLNMTGGSTGTDTTPPASLAAPTGFRDTGRVWRDALELHWDAVPGATGYTIKDLGTGKNTDLGPVTGTMMNGLVHNGSYNYQIAAKDATGAVGPYSSTLSAHTKN